MVFIQLYYNCLANLLYYSRNAKKLYATFILTYSRCLLKNQNVGLNVNIIGLVIESNSHKFAKDICSMQVGFTYGLH